MFIKRTIFTLLITLSCLIPNVHAFDNGFIPLPKLPSSTQPVRKSGESAEAYATRVLALHKARASEVFALQKEFRLAVEDRNKRLLSSEKVQSPNLLDPLDPLYLAYKDVSKIKDLNHDLDVKLHEKHLKLNEKRAWLFIVAIEDYEKTDPVLFAHRTAQLVKSTFQKKLDISDRNIVMLLNKEATKKNITSTLRKLVQRVQRNDVIYFYYCGHGVSNKNGEQFLLPYDGDPEVVNNANAVSIERVYNKFLNSRALRTFSFIDSSFTGVTDAIPLRKGLEKNMMRPRPEGYYKRLNILNSARSQDTSNAYYSKGYRLFSYYLAKEVLSKPQNAGELFDSIRTKIREISLGYGDRYLQEPEFFGYRELSIQNN